MVFISSLTTLAISMVSGGLCFCSSANFSMSATFACSEVTIECTRRGLASVGWNRWHLSPKKHRALRKCLHTSGCLSMHATSWQTLLYPWFGQFSWVCENRQASLRLQKPLAWWRQGPPLISIVTTGFLAKTGPKPLLSDSLDCFFVCTWVVSELFNIFEFILHHSILRCGYPFVPSN